MTETNQTMLFLIPEAESQGFEAAEQGNGWHGLKQWLRVVTTLQIVIGNPWAQVVNVMKSDVARKPLEDFGQFVE